MFTKINVFSRALFLYRKRFFFFVIFSHSKRPRALDKNIRIADKLLHK